MEGARDTSSNIRLWLPSLCNFANDAAWIACGQNSIRDIARNHACANDGSRADAHAGEDQRSAAHPDIRPDFNRLAILLLSPQAGVERVHRGENLHRRAEEREIPDVHRTDSRAPRD